MHGIIKVFNKGTYLVQTEFPCNHSANEQTKFIKKLKKFHRCSFDPTSSIYKVSRPNSLDQKSSKKDNLISQIC
jgi:hypothetical protein